MSGGGRALGTLHPESLRNGVKNNCRHFEKPDFTRYDVMDRNLGTSYHMHGVAHVFMASALGPKNRDTIPHV